MARTPRSARPSTLRGFSLVELSIVVAILSVVATLGLEVAANFVNRSATSVSRERLKVVDEAVAQFFKVYGRLPCPAPIGYGMMDHSTGFYDYGIENCDFSTFINNGGVGNGLRSGGVPFRSLNLPMMYSLDGFSSKLNYVVTMNLTSAGGGPGFSFKFGSSGGTAVQNGTAGIEVRTGKLAQPCNTSNCQVLADPVYNAVSNPVPNGAAYFIFSSGADQRGGVTKDGVIENACTSAPSGEVRPDTQNCVFGNATISGVMSPSTIPVYVFYDNRYNAGLNLSSYFDDVVIWRTKAQL